MASREKHRRFNNRPNRAIKGTMDILSLGTEQDLFVQGSRARARIAAYGAICRSLHIVVPTRGAQQERASIAPNVFAYPTNARSRLAAVFGLFRAASTVIRGGEFDRKQGIVTAQDPFEIGLIALVIARYHRLPLHIQVHTDPFGIGFKEESLRRRVQMLLARIVLPRAAAVRVVSERVRRSIVALGMPHEKVTSIPIHTDWKPIADAPAAPASLTERYSMFSPLILMASRLTKEKNIPLAIDAFERFVARHPSAGLLIIGRGPEERVLRQLVADKRLEKSVVFENWTPDIASYLKLADIFLLASDYEGWGLSIIEAAAAGTPIIMTDVGCAGEFIIDGENGIVIPVRNAQAMDNALERLSASEEFRQTLASRARESIRALPSYDAYLARIKVSWEQALFAA